MIRFNRVKSQEKGQSLLELAVGLFVLLLLIAGIANLGSMMFYYLGMRDAAQEGASYGIIHPTHYDQINSRVISSMENDPNINVYIKIDDQLWAAAPENHKCQGHKMEIIVENQDYPVTMPFLGTFLGSQSIWLKASITDTILLPLTCP